MVAARPAFAELLAQDEATQPWFALVPLRLAQIDARQGEWSSALERARAISTTYPTFRQQFEVDYLIGRCLASLGEYDAARSAYRDVLGSAAASGTETSAMAQWMIGESYLHQRRFEEALNEYLRVDVLHEFPEWQAYGLLQAAKCYAALARYQPASETYTRLIVKFPQSEPAQQAHQRLEEVRVAMRNTRVAEREQENRQL